MHHHYQQQPQQQLCNSHCSVHPYNNQNIPSTTQQNSYYHHYNQPAQPCTVHMQNYVPPHPSVPNNCYQHHLPHSKSLDQYDGKLQGNGSINHHHRLSLDYKMAQQQQQQPPPHLSPSQQVSSFDYIDAAFNHPYNQPNSRAPLPYNLSSNLGHLSSNHEPPANYYQQNDSSAMSNHHSRMFSTNEFYQQQLMQLPTSVNEYHPSPLQPQHHHHQKTCSFSDAPSSSSPAAAIQDELISFSNDSIRAKPPTEVKLRSSLKKGTHSVTSESMDMEQELNELRALKRDKSLTPGSSSSDSKTRDGIGNSQNWDYVFQHLEKDPDKKKILTTDEKIAAELESLKITSKSNGHGPPKDRHSHKSNNRTSSIGNSTMSTTGHSSSQTKARTKSVSTATDASKSNYEHKRTSSVMESNQRIQMQKPPELIVGPNEWSCRFCTFLNPNSKKICEMCSKSKDFFLDADKSSTATCV